MKKIAILAGYFIGILLLSFTIHSVVGHVVTKGEPVGYMSSDRVYLSQYEAFKIAAKYDANREYYYEYGYEIKMRQPLFGWPIRDTTIIYKQLYERERN